MLPREYETQPGCSVAGTLGVIGDRWTMLVLREAFSRTRRFDDFQRNLGVARNVLTDRLNRLVDEEILERRAYQDNPVRHEYVLTEKGIDLWPVLIALLKWGDRYAVDQPSRLIVHRGCGGQVTDHLHCDRCGRELNARDVESLPGPGPSPAARSAAPRRAGL